MQQNLIQKTQQVLIHNNLLKKDDLANLKSEVDKLDIDKQEEVSNSLNNLKSKVNKLDVDMLASVPTKLNDVVKNNVVKKDVYIAKIKNIENKTPFITNLATNAALTTVDDKIPDASDVV